MHRTRRGVDSGPVPQDENKSAAPQSKRASIRPRRLSEAQSAKPRDQLLFRVRSRGAKRVQSSLGEGMCGVATKESTMNSLSTTSICLRKQTATRNKNDDDDDHDDDHDAQGYIAGRTPASYSHTHKHPYPPDAEHRTDLLQRTSTQKARKARWGSWRASVRSLRRGISVSTSDDR